MQDDAQSAAVETAGRSPSPLPGVSASSAASPDLIRLLHQRRTQLVERETALQRWGVALELEAARQAAAAKQLKAQEERVAGVAGEAASNQERAAALLGEVSQREAALQREAAALAQQAADADAERRELAAERAGLEEATADVRRRGAEAARREAALAAAEDEWETKRAAAEALVEVGQRVVRVGSA